MHLNNFGLEDSDADDEEKTNLTESGLKRRRSKESLFEPKNAKRTIFKSPKTRNEEIQSPSTSKPDTNLIPSLSNNGSNKTTNGSKRNENRSKMVKDHDEFSSIFDDDFPTLESIMAPETIKKERREKISYSEGQLIWGKHRGWSMWPAVVYREYSKKISIVWLPIELPIKLKNGRKTFSISKSNVKPFEPNKEEYCIQNTAKRADSLFLMARIQAEKIFQEKINPFEQSLKISQDDCKINFDDVQYENESDSDDEDVEISGETENTLLRSRPVTFSVETNRIIEQRKFDNQKLLDYFETEECKIYVKKLINDELDTVRTRRWHDMMRNRRIIEQIEPRLGPIIDQEQIDLGADILVEQYRNEKPDDRGTTVSKFVIDVLFPEAIKFAMMKIFGCDDDEAETKLTMLPKLTDEEQKEILIK